MGKIVAASGGFDPLHAGHLEMLEKAKNLAGSDGKLVVILNSDDFLIRKKGFDFMSFKERRSYHRSPTLCPMKIIPCIDQDQTVCAKP